MVRVTCCVVLCQSDSFVTMWGLQSAQDTSPKKSTRSTIIDLAPFVCSGTWEKNHQFSASLCVGCPSVCDQHPSNTFVHKNVAGIALYCRRIASLPRLAPCRAMPLRATCTSATFSLVPHPLFSVLFTFIHFASLLCNPRFLRLRETCSLRAVPCCAVSRLRL